jgi:hypothetical protein
MANAGRSKQPRTSVDWEQAFAFYASLPPGERTYAAVAAHVGRDVRTVETHGRTGRWKLRLREIETKAAARTTEALIEARVAEIEKLRRLIDASLIRFAEQLRDGMRMAPADLERLNRLSRTLIDEISNPHPPPPGDETSAPDRTPEHTEAVLDALAETGIFETLGLARTNRPEPTPTGPDTEGGAQ